VTFFYDFASGEYTLVSGEEYVQKIEAGDYRWGCTTNDPTTKACTKCQSNQFLLTAGRCYNVIQGCALQIASTCISCSNGFLKVGHGCDQSPTKVIE
jgi:hypothetical protein